jgi:hypothetical protein
MRPTGTPFSNAEAASRPLRKTDLKPPRGDHAEMPSSFSFWATGRTSVRVLELAINVAKPETVPVTVEDTQVSR